MRLKTLALLSSMTVLLSGFGSYSWGEFAEEYQISFSLAYHCSGEDNDKNRSPLCLADSLKPGLKVVLVTKDVKCSAKTGRTIKAQYRDPESTGLEGTEKCLILHSGSLDVQTCVAVLGVDASEVRVIEPKTDKSFLSAETQLKAHKIASSEYYKDVADSPTDVFGVGNTAFLLFNPSEVLDYYGLPVLVLNNNAFPLQGLCVDRPFFFSVKEKLYVSYWAADSCCACGEANFFVYDLSGESPKLVYKNNEFSN